MIRNIQLNFNKFVIKSCVMYKIKSCMSLCKRGNEEEKKRNLCCSQLQVMKDVFLDRVGVSGFTAWPCISLYNLYCTADTVYVHGKA